MGRPITQWAGESLVECYVSSETLHFVVHSVREVDSTHVFDKNLHSGTSLQDT